MPALLAGEAVEVGQSGGDERQGGLRIAEDDQRIGDEAVDDRLVTRLASRFEPLG